MSIPVMDLNLCALECFPLTLHTRKRGSEDIDSLHKGHIGCTWNETWTISWQDLTTDGPCLVEMNCRSHIGDGNWTSLSSIQSIVWWQVLSSRGHGGLLFRQRGIPHTTSHATISPACIWAGHFACVIFQREGKLNAWI